MKKYVAKLFKLISLIYKIAALMLNKRYIYDIIMALKRKENDNEFFRRYKENTS